MTKQFRFGEDYPVVQTQAGKVRGYEWNGICTFKGIKYADAKRFMYPEKVKPWDGVKDAQSYGMVCPLMDQDNPSVELMVPHMYWPMDEHCQYLNIWTPSIQEGVKKPVMVWLHGGGFFAGSSIEQLAYDGEAMAKNGDVVVVSLNHRLNLLGYLDLSPFGEKYKYSANAGQYDMIAALKWVRDNIAGFGGDPDNVTIFGQSGGGAKVWTLMQMPEADGLFHKGIIQSGVYDLSSDAEDADGKEIVTAMLKELGLAETEVEKLETIPYAQMVEAYKKVAPEIAKKGGYIGCYPHKDDTFFGDPRVHGFREETKQIPILIGTVFGEFDFGPAIPGKKSLSEEETKRLIQERLGKEGANLIPLFRETYPDKSPVDLRSVDVIFRKSTIDFIKKRANCHAGAVYSYQFVYEFPMFEGKIAWHCSEIPFVFHNIDKAPVCYGEGAEKLQADMFGAWISFAKTGKPMVEGVEWPASTAEDEAMLLFDKTCVVKHNLDHKLIVELEEVHKKIQMQMENVQH